MMINTSGLRQLEALTGTCYSAGVCCSAECYWTLLTPAARRPAHELPRPGVPYKFLPVTFFSILGHFGMQLLLRLPGDELI